LIPGVTEIPDPEIQPFYHNRINPGMAMKGRKFERSMLEYSKIILSKISFDRRLFKKEYWKAIKHLSADERVQLKNWVRSEWQIHAGLIESA
jgi:hypothetical protein